MAIFPFMPSSASKVILTRVGIKSAILQARAP